MRIRSAGCGQHVVISGSVGNLLADVYGLAVDDSGGSPVDQIVNERGIRILIDLLDSSGELVGRLCPVVILHCDHKHGLDRSAAGSKAAERS